MSATIEDMKAEARAMRAEDAALTHSAALETVAKRHGYRDWNAAAGTAQPGQKPLRFRRGQAVAGEYLGRPFTGRIIDVEPREDPGWVRVGVDLDAPLRVSDIEGLNATRKRLRGNLGPNGETAERISTGAPQLKLFAP